MLFRSMGTAIAVRMDILNMEGNNMDKKIQIYSLTEGSISTTILKFAMPFLLSSFLQALYGAADLFVVGQFGNSAGVSAVAIGSQVMQTITGIILGISMGGTVLIGRRIGENNERKAAEAIGNLVSMFLLLAVVLTPLMLLCTDGAVSLMETPREAVSDTRQYLFICSLGIPFIIGYNGVSGIFRGMGNSRTPVYFIALACVINIGADFLFVGGFHMGAAGAAAATSLAQGISFLTALFYLWKKGFPFPFHTTDLKPEGDSVKQILIVGFPLALQDALVNISFLAITAIINTMGLIASAAVGVVEKIIVFAMLPMSSFASATATMTAQNIGAGKPRRAFRSLAGCIGYSLIFGIAFCIYAQFLPETLTGLFTRDAAVRMAAGQYLGAYAIDCILVSFVFCMNSYFSGCGNSMISFVHSMIATFGVRIPVTYLMSKRAANSLYPMGLAAPAASLVSILICFGYFFWKSAKNQKTGPKKSRGDGRQNEE